MTAPATLAGGVWRVPLAGPPAGPLALWLDGAALAAVPVEPGPDSVVAVAVIPPAALAEGLRTLLLAPRDAPSAVLGRLPLWAGRPVEADLLAELDALRAELTLVKAELRRVLRSR